MVRQWLLLLSAVVMASAMVCENHRDCSLWNSQCIHGVCAQSIPTGMTPSLIGLGGTCSQHSDCASFLSLGNQSCTAKCTLDSKCLAGSSQSFSLCCAGAPISGICTPSLETKPALFTACEYGLLCKSDDSSQNTGTCQSERQSLWWVGVLITCASAFVQNLGVNIQKLAITRNLKKEKNQRNLVTSPIWIVGIIVMVVGCLLVALALKYAAQSLVTPLGAIALICNLFLATCLNGEKVGLRDIFASFLIILGCSTVVIFSNHEDREYSLCYMLKAYEQFPVIIMFSLMGVVIVCCMVCIHFHNYKLKQQERKNIRETVITVHANELNTHMEVRAGKRTNPEQSPTTSIFFPFLYAILGGTMAALTVLFAKSSVQIIDLTIQGDNQFHNPVSFVLVGALISFAICQLYYLNKGLKRYDALFQVPVEFVVQTIGSIVCGAVYFGEFDNFDIQQTIFFVLGILLTFSGVVVLAGRLHSEEKCQEKQKCTK